MATQPADHEHEDRNPPGGVRRDRLTVDELLRRAQPLPPHEEMVIEGVTEEESAAFLAALED